MLERGEKIDSLVAKSDGLSAQSKMFYTQVGRFELCGPCWGMGMSGWLIAVGGVGKEAEFVLRGYVKLVAMCRLAG